MPVVAAEEVRQDTLIQFAVSPVDELILSLGALLPRPDGGVPARLADFVRRAREALGPALLADLEELGRMTKRLHFVLELSFDCPNREDVPGFLDYVAGLSDDDLLFRLWGRIVPRESFPRLREDPKAAQAAVLSFYQEYGDDPAFLEPFLTMLADPRGLRERLLRVLRAHWERTFAAEIPVLRPLWLVSIAEKQEALRRQGPEQFLRRINDGRPLPPMFPEEYPLREVLLVPTLFISRPNMIVWGYGKTVILYDAELTESQRDARNRETEHIVNVARALGDANRLRILSLIAARPELYGSKLAHLCGISAPAVSRHMAILKQAGLVRETNREGRSFYSLEREALERFCAGLHQQFLPEIVDVDGG